MIAAERHNNPGDVSLPIKGWHGGGRIVGVQGQPGYAEFPTMHVGFEAFKQRIRAYVERGDNTIRKISRIPYATDPKWFAAIVKLSGVGADEVLNTSAELALVCAAIIKQESGKSLAQLGLSLED